MSSSNDYYTFRANRDPRRELITDMERYGEANIATFLRTYFPETDTRTGRTFPNHRFLPLIETVVQTNETLETFDDNDGLLDQVIFGVTHPDLCHPGVKDICGNRELVLLLTVRHFKKSGGIVLPPLPSASALQDAHAQGVRADIAANREPGQMHYANWLQAQMTPPPLDFGRGGSFVRGGRGGGAAGSGVGRGRGSQGRQ